MIVISSKDTFPARFPNIFVDYPLGQMCVGDKLWTHWNKAPMQLWHTQLNFAVWCASSACGEIIKGIVYHFFVVHQCRRCKLAISLFTLSLMIFCF